MSPTRRKTAKAKITPQKKILIRAGLIKDARLKDTHRKKLAKLTKAEVRALVSAKRKLGYKGSMHLGGAIF